jgi:hypothetical protein
MDEHSCSFGRDVDPVGRDATGGYEGTLARLDATMEYLMTLRDELWSIQLRIETRIALNEKFLAEQQVRLQNGSGLSGVSIFKAMVAPGIPRDELPLIHEEPAA